MSQPTRPTETTDQKGDANVRHTPGPWHYQIDSHRRGRVFAGNMWLATTWTFPGDYGVGTPLPAAANARLIAAAPDMYTLIKAEYDANRGFETLPLGYPRKRAEAISNIVKAVEGGAA